MEKKQVMLTSAHMRNSARKGKFWPATEEPDRQQSTALPHHCPHQQQDSSWTANVHQRLCKQNEISEFRNTRHPLHTNMSPRDSLTPKSGPACRTKAGTAPRNHSTRWGCRARGSMESQARQAITCENCHTDVASCADERNISHARDWCSCNPNIFGAILQKLMLHWKKLR